MDQALNFIIPLTKVDAQRREVWGVAAVEQLDSAGEIFDYQSSKPYIMQWSDRFLKSTQGKSKGNIRGDHGGRTRTAGKVISLEFDDAQRMVKIGTKIVDPTDWEKVQEGVYTGFSIGGSYAKKWPDPSGVGMRYTAALSEISLVDSPAIPGATFEYIKADGAGELRKFANPPQEESNMDINQIIAGMLESDNPDIVKLGEQLKAAQATEETPEPESTDPADQSQQAPGAGAANGDEAQAPESGETQPPQMAGGVTAEQCRAICSEVCINMLAELGLVKPAGGAGGETMSMSTRVEDLSKALDALPGSIADLVKYQGELRSDIAKLAIDIEALKKSGGVGPVLRSLGTLTQSDLHIEQQREALTKAMEAESNPLVKQDLQAQLTTLAIRETQTKK